MRVGIVVERGDTSHASSWNLSPRRCQSHVTSKKAFRNPWRLFALLSISRWLDLEPCCVAPTSSLFHRRTLLSSLSSGMAASHLASAVAAKSASGDTTMRWRPLGSATDAYGDSLMYPSWMLGTWEATYSQTGLDFPQGFGVFGADLPGVLLAAMLSNKPVSLAHTLRAPTIYLTRPSNSVSVAKWRFVNATTGSHGVQSDWAFTLRSSMDAFMSKPQTQVSRGFAYAQPGIILAYDSPSFGQQNVSISWIAADALQGSNHSFKSSEWLRQFDPWGVNGMVDYKIVTSLSRGNQEGHISGNLSLAVFLESLDPGYLDGTPVAVCNFDVSLRRMWGT